MSFVLDALKMSEHRRSRLRRRVYAHPPPVRRAGRAWRWLAIPAAVAAVALVILAWRLAAPGAQDGGAGAALQQHTAKASGADPALAASDSEGEIIHANDAGGAASRSGAQSSDTTVSGSEPGQAAPGPSKSSGAMQGAPAPDPAESSGMDGAMEQSGSAPSGQAARAVTAPPPGWPTLALQMHFFSEDQNRSFVQVNGKTYRAGEQLAAGPHVLGISSAGVTLAYQGERILLGMER